jgi:predicted metal-dependent hydrolase
MVEMERWGNNRRGGIIMEELGDKIIEREVAFTDEWFLEKKMDRTPTFAEAIEWERVRLQKKVERWRDLYLRKMNVPYTHSEMKEYVAGQLEATERILDAIKED